MTVYIVQCTLYIYVYFSVFIYIYIYIFIYIVYYTSYNADKYDITTSIVRRRCDAGLGYDVIPLGDS